MKRFKIIAQENWSRDIDAFYKYYGTGYFYNVISYHKYYDERDRLQRLLALRRQDIQDYIYIQLHGIFSSPEKLGDWFEESLQVYQDEIRYIQFGTDLNVYTKKKYDFTIIPMKIDVGTEGIGSHHYDGLKFDTFPPPGCPIMHNGKIIGHMPEDKPEAP
jgi:hypothetical protein